MIQQTRSKVKPTTLILCPSCKADFEEGGQLVVKIGWQDMWHSCDICRTGRGFEYGIHD